MESALEKLGVYEFFTVFLAGIISETLLCIVLRFCFGISIAVNENIWAFLIVGYFGGLLLHELSVYLKEPFRKMWFSTSFTVDDRFFKGEDLAMAQRVKSFILKKDEADTTSDDYVASVCCNELQVKGQFSNAGGLQKESEFALSLSIAFVAIAGITGAAMIYCNQNQIKFEECRSWLAVALTLLLSVLFFFRSKRMHKYYTRCLIRTFAVVHDLTSNDAKK